MTHFTDHERLTKLFMGRYIHLAFAGPLRNALAACSGTCQMRSASRMAEGKTVPAIFQTGSVRSGLMKDFPMRERKHAEDLEAFFFGGEGTHLDKFRARILAYGVQTWPKPPWRRLFWLDMRKCWWPIPCWPTSCSVNEPLGTPNDE